MPVLALTFKKRKKTWLTIILTLWNWIIKVCARKKVIVLLNEKDGIKYSGQYVCFEKFDSKKVVAANKDPLLAIAEAKQKGYQNPVVFFVPPTDNIQIYSAQAA